MSGTSSSKRRQAEAAEREQVLRISRKVSATLGNDFFQSLVKHIADALGADCVFLSEVIQVGVPRIDTLAVCLNGEWTENFQQDLSGTASSHAVSDGNVAYPQDVTELFPEDQVLGRMQAQAFVGQRLSDSDGGVLGVLAAVYCKRLEQGDVAKSILEAFTPRAAVELERKRNHDVLRKADERHRAFVASNMDAMWRIEFERPVPIHLTEDEQIDLIYRYGYMAECNAAFARLLSAPPTEELIGARFAAIVPPNDTRLIEELRSSIRSGYRTTAVETMPLDALGRRLYRLRSQFGIVENGELCRIWGTVRDITGLRRAELALEASERRCREMLERLRLPAVVVDPTGKVLFANDALVHMCRWPKEESATRNWFEGLADEKSRDVWKAALRYEGTGPTVAHLEGPILCVESIPRQVSWDTTLLLDTDGGVQGIAAVGVDITSQRAVDAQIRQAEKLEGIERMAAGVAHDFNNLLLVIIGEISLLLEEVRGSGAMQRSLSAIQSSAAQCAELTRQLRAIGCKQPLDPIILNLNSVIFDAEPVIRGLLGEEIGLDLRLDPSLRSVKADLVQIQRVLSNLAANARDAMPNGGRLTIVTANAKPDETSALRTAGLEPGTYVRLTVTDTGCGMSEDVQARIFDPFFTTKPMGVGTGLGLSTVCGIVRQSGGFISVHSRPGEGASFSIFLPAAEVPANQHRDQNSGRTSATVRPAQTA
jgi:signal transduction histidine kinase